MSAPDFYTLEPGHEPQGEMIATAAIRSCAICDHIVSGMGGPGVPSICPQCFTLLRHGQIKINRDDVVAAVKDREGDS